MCTLILDEPNGAGSLRVTVTCCSICPQPGQQLVFPFNARQAVVVRALHHAGQPLYEAALVHAVEDAGFLLGSRLDDIFRGAAGDPDRYRFRKLIRTAREVGCGLWQLRTCLAAPLRSPSGSPQPQPPRRPPRPRETARVLPPQPDPCDLDQLLSDLDGRDYLSLVVRWARLRSQHGPQVLFDLGHVMPDGTDLEPLLRGLDWTIACEATTVADWPVPPGRPGDFSWEAELASAPYARDFEELRALLDGFYRSWIAHGEPDARERAARRLEPPPAYGCDHRFAPWCEYLWRPENDEQGG